MTDLQKTKKRKLLFPILIISVFSLFLVLPVIAKMIPKQNPDAGLEEKRALAEFPQVSEGDAFFTDLNQWFDDHIPFRLRLISAKKKISQKIEQVYRKNVHPFLSKLSTPDWYDSAEYADRKTWDAPYLAPLEDNFAVYGREDWLFYSGELNLPYFTGTNLLDEATEKNWENVFLKLQEFCDERGILLSIMVAPNKEQVYPEFVPNYYIETADKREIRFARYLEESGLNFRYLLGDLEAAKPYGDTYLKQDTHWNALGGYTAFSAMMTSIGSPIAKPGEVTLVPSAAQGGDLSNFCGYATTYPVTGVSYKPEITITRNEETTYPKGNGSIRILESDCPGSRKIVLVGDSFRDAVVPFLPKEFSHAVSIHRDAIHEPDALNTIAELGEGDVLWLLAVERYDSGNAYAADVILKGLD